MAVLPTGMSGPELAREEVSSRRQPLQRMLDFAQRQVPANRRVRAEERDVGAGPAQQQRNQWVVGLFQERIGKANREGDTERVAIASCILGGDPSFFVGDPNQRRAARLLELFEPFQSDAAGLSLGGRQVAQPS